MYTQNKDIDAQNLVIDMENAAIDSENQAIDSQNFPKEGPIATYINGLSWPFLGYVGVVSGVFGWFFVVIIQSYFPN